VKGMVDVGEKPCTRRFARAAADVVLGEKAFAALLTGASPKGDALEAARIAGIMAAKATPYVIPMCHPINIDRVGIDFKFDEKEATVVVLAEVEATSQTGVEMEAMHAASVAALTIYDMLKWADKGITISEIRLLEKRGGKSGDYQRE